MDNSFNVGFHCLPEGSIKCHDAYPVTCMSHTKQVGMIYVLAFTGTRTPCPPSKDTAQSLCLLSYDDSQSIRNHSQFNYSGTEPALMCPGDVLCAHARRAVYAQVADQGDEDGPPRERARGERVVSEHVRQGNYARRRLFPHRLGRCVADDTLTAQLLRNGSLKCAERGRFEKLA